MQLFNRLQDLQKLVRLRDHRILELEKRISEVGGKNEELNRLLTKQGSQMGARKVSSSLSSMNSVINSPNIGDELITD